MISILSLIISFLFVLFAVFLLTVKSNNRISNILIASFLMITAFDISVYYYANVVTIHPILEMLRIRSSEFKSPLFFLYILSVIYQDFRFKYIHLANVLPFIISVLILFPRFFLAGFDQQETFLANYVDMPEIKWIAFFSYAVSLVYIIASYVVIKRYKTVVLENYAVNASLTTYYFLHQLVILIIIGFSLTFIKEVFLFNASFALINIARIVILIFGLFFSSWLVLKALHRPKLFRGIDEKILPIKEVLVEKTTESIPTIKENKAIEQQIQDLKKYMLEEEPYLDSSLTVHKLSRQLNLPSRELSILINHHINQHFFEFINEYRIKKAMEILSDYRLKDLTISEILYQVGFNSKSSFNTAFKKITSLTPSAYRKVAQNQ